MTVKMKLRLVRAEISNWKKRAKTNSELFIKDLKREINHLTHQKQINTQHLQSLKHQLKMAYKEEEIYWKLQSRVHWLREGDKNTKFFHASARQRRSTNNIHYLLKEGSNSPIYGEKEMGAVAVEYFSDLFTSDGNSVSPQEEDRIFGDYVTKLSFSQNQALMKEVTMTEVKRAAFDLGADRSPGPDGLTGSFYQQWWDLVGHDILKMIQNFMATGLMDNKLNSTNICLIPKVAHPHLMTEFRPISLCNFGYKILSKLLATRLKEVLPILVSENQAAFIKGRLITDNILLAHEIVHSLRTSQKISTEFLALKTDMSKAFDRLEWQFLERTMSTMGFSEEWINRIMVCITTPSYGVLINGCPYGSIVPSRGLRQGDPLSPFLFILCSEMLANSLRRAEMSKRITGVKLGKTGPAITHLMFADDSIFFVKAAQGEAMELKSILETYEKLSGQKINLSKSSIIFGNKVSILAKKHASTMLGISSQGGKGIYLGLPEVFLGSKLATLRYIEKKLEGRILSWKNRFLSPGGKETLLKAVALALPTFSMSCFSLPKSLLGKLTKMMASFWWKNQDTGRGIHWHSWKKLTRNKKHGGIGFRDLEGFNQALLGKQLWRLANNPESLIGRVLKSRYYPKTTILEAKIGQRPSFAWRSIHSTQSLMSKGMKKNFGGGAGINILKDPWIVDLHPRAPIPKAGVDTSQVTLNTIKSSESDEWNLQNLSLFFEEDEVHRICKSFTTPITTETPSFSWIYNNNGNYSVKSGYWTWENLREVTFQPNFSPLYVEIWKLRIPSKLHHFLWRCLTGVLAVGAKLYERKVIKDPECPRCGFTEESVNHTLFECGFARLVWALSQNGLLFHPLPSTSCYSNMCTLLLNHKTGDKDFDSRHRSWPWILWRIWKARNDLCFGMNTHDASQLILLAEEDAKGWDIANQSAATQIHPHVSTTSIRNTTQSNGIVLWKPPDVGALKCNTDGSWKGGSKTSGVGWILRDPIGKTRWYGMKSYPALESPLEAEAAALVWAMNVVDNLSYSNVIFELDCKELYQAIKNPQDWNRLRVYLDDIMKPRRMLQASFALCPRSANRSADLLAKTASQAPAYAAELNCGCSLWLKPTLISFALSSNNVIIST